MRIWWIIIFYKWKIKVKIWVNWYWNKWIKSSERIRKIKDSKWIRKVKIKIELKRIGSFENKIKFGIKIKRIRIKIVRS